MNSPLLEINSITKSYQIAGQDVVVLKQFSMTVGKGEMVSIMGPSGSGKSTLLFILGLFLSPTAGTYSFDNRDVLQLNRKEQAGFRRNEIGFVLQGADLLENSTVYENVEYPLIYAQSKRSGRQKRIHEVLDQVKLSHRIHHSSNQLSGGERQRVAIARALVNHPSVILADEPTGQLDRENSLQVMNYFRAIAEQTETSLVIVTHDQQVAEFCDQIIIIDRG